MSDEMECVNEKNTAIQLEGSASATQIGEEAAAQLPFSCHGLKLETYKSRSCTFDIDIFEGVMINMINNPNLLSSLLYRADIFYDSLHDTQGTEYFNRERDEPSLLIQQMKAELRPKLLGFNSSENLCIRIQRVLVRQLIPRNPRLDKAITQTCYMIETSTNKTEDAATSTSMTIIYLPHVDASELMPFYHPPVKALAIHWTKSDSFYCPECSTSTLSIHAHPNLSNLARVETDAVESADNANRLSRTMENILQTVAKHGTQNAQGYQKRVHHDRIIPRRRYQDTLVRLKLAYAQPLIADWREQTDPTKHVFEDLCISAFLIELWRDMYGLKSSSDSGGSTSTSSFPGFIDIGCGNGLLVHILASEGFEGQGFDVRERKSWDAYPASSQARLAVKTFVPPIYNSSAEQEYISKGTFIVSNHADELTPWTPLLAYIYDCPFIAIPCCSHDLTGQRTRFSQQPKGSLQSMQPVMMEDSSAGALEVVRARRNDRIPAGPASGSLARSEPLKRPSSAFATLCDYVEALSMKAGFVVERDVLRIPSTRNVAILGRTRRTDLTAGEQSVEQRVEVVRGIVESEIRMSSALAAARWTERMERIRGKGGGEH